MRPLGSHQSFALRPPKLTGALDQINFISLRFVVSGTILLIIYCASISVVADEFEPPWLSKNLVGPIKNVIFDERDESFYLAVGHFIYKYSRDLQLLSSSSDSTSPPSVDATTTSSSQSNYFNNKLLFILKRNNPELILACWHTTDLNLKCGLNKLNELKAFTPLIWAGGGAKGYRIDQSDRILAISPTSDLTDIIIATSRSIILNNTETNLIPSLPALARFKLVKYPKTLALEPRSVLPYGTQIEGLNLMHDYVYSFIHKRYTFFLLNDIRKTPTTNGLKESTIKARLARVCNNDTELTSYTEISLTCKHPKENLLIRYAHYDESVEEPSLSVVFEGTGDLSGSSKRPESRSILCIYSLRFIEDYFHRSIGDCFRGRQTTMLLKKFHPESITAPFCQKGPNNPEDWCTSSINPYIDATNSELAEDSSIDLRNIAPVNYVLSTKQGLSDKKDVLFIGTEAGYLIKMGGHQDEEIHFMLDTMKNLTVDHRAGIKLNFADRTDVSTKFFTISRQIVSINSDGSAKRFDVDSCYYYNSCISCLSARDPLDCIWCDDKCSSKETCSSANYSNISCPPRVIKFFPLEGPLTGRTKLTIEGENFGTPKGSLKVKLGDFECDIDGTVRTDSLIQCYSQPVAHPSEGLLEIEVNDETSYIYAKGRVYSHQSYSYKNVSVYGIHPGFGSVHETTKIQVHGSNLDVGANRSIMIGNRECSITDVHTSQIDCYLKPLEAPSISASTLGPQVLKLIIDGSEQSTSLMRNSTSYSLFSTFLVKNESSLSLSEDKSVQNVMELDNGINSTVIVIALLLAVSFTLLCIIIRRDTIPIVKPKLPSPRKSSKDDDLKVTFRNPDSQKFAESRSNILDESQTGLVRLNGSAVSSGYFGRYDQFEQDKPLINNSLDEELISVLTCEKILIDRSKLTLGHVLGSGQFGRVYKGFLKVDDSREMVVVAVKTLHNKSSWYDCLDNRAFLEEGLMMRDFQHENVLALIGVTFESNGLPMVITPFMLYGDLRSYISDEASSPTVRELIDFGTQVAKGMAYLSNMKFVHRDLAARNCMLDEDLVVKVADFGLSRDIYERDYYSSDNQKTKLPVKWMAPESLEKSIYNVKTDVWAFGVLLWELMTRGVVPYPDVDNFDIYRYLKEGRRMLRPRYCPILLYKIMLSCWNEDPTKRPTFDELVINVSDVINQLKTAKDGQQKVRLDETYCDVLEMK